MRARALAPLLFVASLAACGGGGAAARGPNTAAYLTTVKSPLLGTAVPGSDETLLAVGNRACADFDAGERSDVVVANLSGDALPGSAAYNSYSMVAAAAAKYLCPQHAANFSGMPSSLTG